MPRLRPDELQRLRALATNRKNFVGHRIDLQQLLNEIDEQEKLLGQQALEIAKLREYLSKKQDLLDELENGDLGRERVVILQTAIRKHRDQRGDDRCWLDDAELYAVLPEGHKPVEFCDPETMLQNCRRYIASRFDPSQPYVSPQREIEHLQAQVAALANDARLFVPGVWKCPKCKFSLTRTTLNISNGAVGTTHADREEPENCPNDGTPMARESWEQRARFYMEEQGQRLGWIDDKLREAHVALRLCLLWFRDEADPPDFVISSRMLVNELDKIFNAEPPFKCRRCGAVPVYGDKHSPECEAGV